MKKIIRLTESELVGLIKKIIKEEKYSEEDLKYFHPAIGKECKIKIGRNKYKTIRREGYKPVLVCDLHDTGNEFVIAELTFFAPTVEEVKDYICKNYDTVVAELDSLFGDKEQEEEETITETVESLKWEIIDEPIVCGTDEFEI